MCVCVWYTSSLLHFVLFWFGLVYAIYWISTDMQTKWEFFSAIFANCFWRAQWQDSLTVFEWFSDGKNTKSWSGKAVNIRHQSTDEIYFSNHFHSIASIFFFSFFRTFCYCTALLLGINEFTDSGSVQNGQCKK